jgi:hypothetical protein
MFQRVPISEIGSSGGSTISRLITEAYEIHKTVVLKVGGILLERAERGHARGLSWAEADQCAFA